MSTPAQDTPKRCRSIIVDYSRCTAPYECGRRAHKEYGGAWYCGHHHPPRREQARREGNARAVRLNPYRSPESPLK